MTMSKNVDDAEADRHRAKMAKRKALQDAEVAEKTQEKGLLIVHTGTGKGKTTAAFGIALRMLGRGHKVGVVQFIKGAWHSAERDALEKFGDQVSWHSMCEGFTWETQDLQRDIAAAFTKHGFGNLGGVVESLGGRYGYGECRIVRAARQRL